MSVYILFECYYNMNIIGIFDNKETAIIEKNRIQLVSDPEDDNIIIYECKLNEIFTNKFIR